MEAKVDNTLRWRLMPSKARQKNFKISKINILFILIITVKYFLCLNFSLCHRKIFSLCLKMFPCVKAKFPVFPCVSKCFPVSKQNSLCFPCAVATLLHFQTWLSSFNVVSIFCHGGPLNVYSFQFPLLLDLLESVSFRFSVYHLKDRWLGSFWDKHRTE